MTDNARAARSGPLDGLRLLPTAQCRTLSRDAEVLRAPAFSDDRPGWRLIDENGGPARFRPLQYADAAPSRT